MKPSLLLFFIVLTACGSGGGGSGSSRGRCADLSFKGNWRSTPNQYNWHFTESCQGTEDNSCGLSFTHGAPVTPLIEDMTMQITASNGGVGCPNVGDTVTCSWRITGGLLELNCSLGGGWVTYSQY